MGAGELRAAVDAGPLIHLTDIGCLRFLKSFDALYVPDAVRLETVAQKNQTTQSVKSAPKFKKLTFLPASLPALPVSAFTLTTPMN